MMVLTSGMRLAKSRVTRARAAQSVIHAKQVCGQSGRLVRWSQTFTGFPRPPLRRRGPA